MMDKHGEPAGVAHAPGSSAQLRHNASADTRPQSTARTNKVFPLLPGAVRSSTLK